MKNKKGLLYLLGFLVVCIWGVILTRVYAAVAEEKDPAVALERQGNTIKTYIPVLQPDTFHLQLSYGDPFDEIRSVKELAPVVVPAVTANIQMARPMIVPQQIKPINTKYLGYVWNAGNKKKVAIMNQNGKEMMMEEGEVSDQLQLLFITSDSVRVKFKGKTSFITINK